jgi:hypothetical protein
MWLSLICTKLNSAPPLGCADFPVAAKSLEVGTPPVIVHTRPVPTQAMQVRKLVDRFYRCWCERLLVALLFQ